MQMVELQLLISMQTGVAHAKRLLLKFKLKIKKQELPWLRLMLINPQTLQVNLV
jgi:hypothetical protein